MPNYASLKNIFNIKTFTSLSLVCLAIAITTNLVSTNILSTQGINVNQSESETLKIEKENQILAVKIEEESRLQEIEKVAQMQGYKRVSNIVFAPTSSTVALR